MYGLYRAWFGGGATNYPCLQDTFSPPDTVVRVGNEGEHQFVAHKGVLAAHSGYLKALLASAAATTTIPSSSSGDGGDGGGGGGGGGSSASASCSPFDPACATVAAVTIGQSQPVTSVSVSSVGGEAFAPLLNYMYTGRLEVTLDNVYSVLLATHLLHMPGALEQCRAALLRLRAPPALPIPVPTSTATSPPGTAGSILRPIPSRLLVGPSLCWPPTTPLYPPTAPAMSHLPQIPPSVLMQPTGINVVAPRDNKQEQCAHYSEVSANKSPQSSPTQHRKRQRPGSRTPEIASTVALPFVAAAAFTAFAVTSGDSTRASSPSRSVSPSTVSHSPTAHTTSSERGEALQRAASGSRSSRNEQPRNKSTSSEDGPTRGDAERSSARRRARSKETTAAVAGSSVLSVVYDIACCDGPVRFHRVLNENYSSSTCGPVRAPPPQRNCQPEDLSSENDENGGPTTREARSPSNDSSNDDSGASNAPPAGSYTCGYCKHTFKSQYCYRKHAKRHLLPTRINEVAADANARQEAAARPGRREVRLLDLNVQYYPCKICGCKFPSYYFVHKHRKLCHANDEERQAAEAADAP